MWLHLDAIVEKPWGRLKSSHRDADRNVETRIQFYKTFDDGRAFVLSIMLLY